MIQKKMIQYVLLAGYIMAVVIPASGYAGEVVRDPQDPSKIITPTGPAPREATTIDDNDHSEEATSVNETKQSQTVDRKTERSKRLFLSDIFSPETIVMTNPDDAHDGDGNAPEKKEYLADIAFRFAGKVLLAQ